MSLQNAIVTITALFIMGMVWLRTRMHYPQRGGTLLLTRAGRGYFGCALGLLLVGWGVAPPIGQALWPSPAVTPTLLRVVWSLAVYYIFIFVHRVLKSRQIAVFRPSGESL